MTTVQAQALHGLETGSWVIDKAHTRIEFAARHLMVTKVRGHFEEYEASIEVADDVTESRIEASFRTDSVTTGAEDRDNHLRSEDFFGAQDHPTMDFVSTSIERDGAEFTILGDLTIKGEKRPLTLKATFEGVATDPWGNDHVGFTASAVLNREDWGLTWNAPLEGGGWLVSKDVQISIDGQLIRP